MNSVRRLLYALALLVAGLPAGLFAASAISSNATANLVLGQTLFTTNTTQFPATPTTLTTPSSVAVDPVSNKVFVADQGSNRVLRYASQTALTSGATPEFAFGQLNFSGSSANQGNPNPSQTSLSGPTAVFVDSSGRLWISDTGNNRVLMFQNAANLFGMPAFADRVYGQTLFTTATASPTVSTMAAPAGLCVDPAGVLWVADSGSHRVLGFQNAANLSNGGSATRVLGQTTFTGNTAGTTQTKLFNPTSVSANATQVWVADTGNNRVLLFSNYPTTNGAPAGLVIGQATYISSTPATSANGLTSPTSVALSGSSLWVADSGNNRFLNFPITASITNNATATVVVGQATFLTGTPGLSAQKVSLNANQINVDSASNLWVADQLNNRVLRFGAQSTIPTVAISGPINVVTSASSYSLKGTAASATGIARVSYQIGSGGYFRATGTTSWSAKISVREGTSRVQVISVGTNGQLSVPAYVKIVRSAYPAVAISGSQSITTTASSVTIYGTAAAAVGIARVSYQVGSTGYFRATGTTNWHATISVKSGVSRIEFRSVGSDGAVSDPVYVNVTRN